MARSPLCESGSDNTQVRDQSITEDGSQIEEVETQKRLRRMVASAKSPNYAVTSHKSKESQNQSFTRLKVYLCESSLIVWINFFPCQWRDPVWPKEWVKPCWKSGKILTGQTRPEPYFWSFFGHFWSVFFYFFYHWLHPILILGWSL